MAYGLYHVETRQLHLANAGLPHAILVRDGGIERLNVGGTPLGLLSDRTYDSTILETAPGDVVVVCSDGLTESENRRDESFEAVGLQAALRGLLSGTAQEIAGGLNRAALEFAGGVESQRDDYTVIVLKFD